MSVTPGRRSSRVDLVPVRQGPALCRRGRRLGEQQRLEGGVVEVLGQRPGEPSLARPAQVVGHRGERDAQRRRHLAARQALAQANRRMSRTLRMARRGLGTSHLLGAGTPRRVAGPLSSRGPLPSLLRGVRKPPEPD